MFPNQTIQQEKPSFELPKPRAIDENRKCLICGNEVEREIVDLNCSCFRHRLCHFCAYLVFETPGIEVVIIKNAEINTISKVLKIQ